MTGRLVSIEALQALAAVISRRGVSLRFSGTGASVDMAARVITLPHISGPLITPELFALLEMYVDHESAHILYTDFKVWSNTLLSTTCDSTAVHRLTNWVEDGRVETLLSAEYPGCRERFEAFYPILRAEDVATTHKKDLTPADWLEVVGMHLRAAGTPWAVDDSDTFPAVTQPVLGSLSDFVTQAKKCEDTGAVCLLAQQIIETVDVLKAFRVRAPEQERLAAAKAAAKRGTEQGAAGSKHSTLLTKLLAEITLHHKEVVYLADPSAITTRVEVPNAEKYSEMLESCPPIANILAAELEERLFAMVDTGWEENLETGKLHTRGVTKWAATDGRHKPFRRRRQSELVSTVVAIAIDLSGSTLSPAYDGAKVSKAEQIRQATILLNLALSAAQIPHAVFGFRTDQHLPSPKFGSRKHHLHLSVFRDFDDYGTAYTLGSIKAKREENADGESLMLVWDRLTLRPELRKLLIVISDGLPTGCSSQTASATYLSWVAGFLQERIEVYSLDIGNGQSALFYKNVTPAGKDIAESLLRLVKSILT